jgi:DNA-binding CsgD family transcriptional regulator
VSAVELSWPLIGRDTELDTILRARDGAPGVVVFAPAGVGKSRLAREAAAAAEAAGAMVSWVQATRSAATVPLAACAELLPPDVRADEPLQLLRRSVQSLRERAEGRDILVAVDDAQRLDPASAALILHLVATRAAFVLATIRSGEPCPDAITSLWKDAGALRLELPELSEAQTGELVERALGGQVEERARRFVHQRTRGNVLYARELIAGAAVTGAFAEHGGVWRLVGKPSPSTSLSELIGERMQELTRDERAAVELLALGEPLRLRELVALAGADAAAGVEARGLATIADGLARLAHPLYGDVVRASLPAVRAVEARLRLADTVLAREQRTHDDALLIARWRLDAGEPVTTELLLEAATAASTAGDPELAQRLSRLALDQGAGVPAALVLARALSVRSRHEEAEQVLAAIEGQIEDRDAGELYLHQRSLGLQWGLRRPQSALALLERAYGWWPDEAWQLQISPLRVRLLAATSGYGSAMAESAQALDDPALDPVARRRMSLVHTTNCFYSGSVRQAFERILPLRPAPPLHEVMDELAMVLACVIAMESGWGMDDAYDWLRQAFEASVRADEHAGAGMSAVTLGAIHVLKGQYLDAGRWLAESVGHLERNDPYNSLKSAHALLVGAAYFTGDGDGAAAALERCRGVTTSTTIDTDRAYALRGEAWAELAAGDPQAAQTLLLEGAERMSLPVYVAQLYYEALRAGAPARLVAGPLEELRERCDGRLALAYADDALARAAGHGAALMGIVDEFEAIGTLRYAAECAAAAASAFVQEGRMDSARRAAARSAALHARGQAGFAPELHGLVRGAVELTRRETQLVELARRGLSNPEIAERLVLSVRTVESHIYNAMQKLGVSDRRDL